MDLSEEMELDTPILSIYVPTFNHENYIVKALESILMQKTKYSYEVLVGEDCSTDHTREVLEKFEATHPGKFTIFYREHNMYKESPNNSLDLKLRCRGKYIIALEGDDYWIDPLKLEKQVSFLEEHPEYIAVAHNCQVVDHNSDVKGETYPQCMDAEYTFDHYSRDIMPGQLTTVMYRNVYKEGQYNLSLLNKGIAPGDRVIYFWLRSNGKIRCFQETMSAYRHVTDRGSSYSASARYRFENYEKLFSALMQYAEEINVKEAYAAAQSLYFRNLVDGLRYRQCGIGTVLRNFQKIKNKIYVPFIYLVRKLESII